MSNKVDLLTPVGRMVQGHPFEEQKTDFQGNPLVTKRGPNAGQPRVEYFFAIAVAKTDPQYPAFLQQVQAVAMSSYPGGEYNQPTFAWKIKDGDDPKYADRVGFPGHWIINCSGGFQPKVYTANGASQIVDAKQIKRGDYVRAYVSVKSNDATGLQAGVYINPHMVEVVGYGEEIITGPSGDQVFGAAPATLPPGASSTPVAPAGALAPPQQQNMAPPQQQNMAPPQQQSMAPPQQQNMAPPQQQNMAPPASNVAPAPDFLNPDERKVIYNGADYTVGFLKTQGWSDEQIATLPAA